MASTLSKQYIELMKRFPLRPIRTEEEAEKASEIFSELGMRNDRSQDEDDYFSVLGCLLSEYERTDPGIQEFLNHDMSATELLEFLLEENSYTQTSFAEEVGIDRANLSGFLSGRRELSKQNALKIAKRFGLPVEKFLE